MTPTPHPHPRCRCRFGSTGSTPWRVALPPPPSCVGDATHNAPSIAACPTAPPGPDPGCPITPVCHPPLCSSAPPLGPLQAWAIRALVINELTAPRWQVEVVPGVTVGDTIMEVCVCVCVCVCV